MSIILVLLAPFIEIAGFVWFGPILGVAGTLAFVLISAVAGLALLRVQGMAALLRLRRDLDAGTTPVPAVLDGGLRIGAALLLIVPGFFSTALGLLLLVPPLRALAAAAIGRRLRTGGTIWVVRTGRQGPAAPVIDGDFREVTPSRIEPPAER